MPRRVDGSSSLQKKLKAAMARVAGDGRQRASLGWSATRQPDLAASDALRGAQNSPGGVESSTLG